MRYPSLVHHLPLIGELLVPAAELLKKESLREKIQPVLRSVYQAGVEVVSEGRVSKEMEDQIQKPLITPGEMAKMANLWWDKHISKG
jgi:hypothetical protein